MPQLKTRSSSPATNCPHCGKPKATPAVPMSEIDRLNAEAATYRQKLTQHIVTNSQLTPFQCSQMDLAKLEHIAGRLTDMQTGYAFTPAPSVLLDEHNPAADPRHNVTLILNSHYEPPTAIDPPPFLLAPVEPTKH
ncbi:MAG: hypothetical protein AB7P18_05600 [Candidatus Binatia bacterium]